MDKTCYQCEKRQVCRIVKAMAQAFRNEIDGTPFFTPIGENNVVTTIAVSLATNCSQFKQEE